MSTTSSETGTDRPAGHARRRHTSAQTARDPTRTKTLRRSFGGDTRSRWRTVRGVIRDAIEHNDALRLREDAGGPDSTLTLDRAAKRPRTTALDFGTTDDAERIARLHSWLGDVFDAHLVEPVADDRAFAGAHWTATYISRAFAAGVSRGGTILRQSGYTPADGDTDPSDLLNVDPYRDAIRRRRWLTYNDIRHAAEVARTKAVRTLADAIGGDLSPREAADMLVDRVDAVGRNRTDTTAETRIIDAYNQALGARYLRAGVERVGIVPESHAPTDGEERQNARTHAHTHGIDRRHVQSVEHRHDHDGDDVPDEQQSGSSTGTLAGAAVAGAAAGAAAGALSSNVSLPSVPSLEWTTANDDRVCARCRKRAGTTYRLRDILFGDKERPPLHPNCRCLLRPA